LTAEAAQAAGYARMTLLEEPQAALYSWIQKSDGAVAQAGEGRRHHPGRGRGRRHDRPVVDCGYRTRRQSRTASCRGGEHILLGGDNMDLALAHVVARKLAAQGTQADPWQLRALTYACRAAKETLLTDRSTDTVPLVVPSRGVEADRRLDPHRTDARRTHADDSRRLLPASRSIGAAGEPGARRPDATRPAVCAGCGHHAASGRVPRPSGRSARRARRTAAVRSRGASFLHPTAVLFNGGVFKSPLLVERILQTLNGWLAAEGAAPARLLEGADLDLAVARGAAYYGYVKRGQGVRIRGGTARAYYIAIESAMPAVPGLEPPVQALCVAPFGMEEGTEAELAAAGIRPRGR
jgi:molecular chaperone DnaK (HSP70)